MKRILVIISAVTLILLSSCKTSEDCPKAYSQNATIEAAQ